MQDLAAHHYYGVIKKHVYLALHVVLFERSTPPPEKSTVEIMGLKRYEEMYDGNGMERAITVDVDTVQAKRIDPELADLRKYLTDHDYLTGVDMQRRVLRCPSFITFSHTKSILDGAEKAKQTQFAAHPKERTFREELEQVNRKRLAARLEGALDRMGLTVIDKRTGKRPPPETLVEIFEQFRTSMPDVGSPPPRSQRAPHR